MGVDEELVDRDYPTLFVYKETWAKMMDAKERGETAIKMYSIILMPEEPGIAKIER